jgi:Mg2+/Co2+ transporter CorC
MKKNDSVKRELAKASKSLDRISKTMVRVKACKATYVLNSTVRTVSDGQTVVRTMTTYHQTRKSAYERMAEQYKEVTGTGLVERDDFVRFVSVDESVVAMFEIYKPAVS